MASKVVPEAMDGEEYQTIQTKVPKQYGLLGHILDYICLPWEGPMIGSKVLRSQTSVYLEIERQKDVNRFIIHPFSRFRAFWDVLMVLVLISTLVILPIELAFYSDDLHEPRWMFLNLFMDAIFMLDILINFRTAFINPYTEEVELTNKAIFRNYLSGWFVLDLISSFPIDYIVSGHTSSGDSVPAVARTIKILRMARLLSLFRIFRFVRLMRYVQKIEEVMLSVHSNSDSKSIQFEGRMMTFLNLLFVIAVFSHWNGCIQYFVPYLLGFPEDSWPVLENITALGGGTNTSIFTIYTHSVYRAMSHMVSIGYGHKKPINVIEIWLTILSMMLGATCYAIFIGHISSLVMALNYSGRKFEEKVAECREYMKFRKIPLSIQQKVMNYYEHRYQRKIFDEKGILHSECMSNPLKKEILMHNCQGLVEKVVFLATGSEDLIIDIIMKLQPQVYFPGDVICTSGKRGTEMFFIEHGRVEVTLRSGKVIKTLDDGMHFGEIALLCEERRVATVTAIEVCDIYILNKRDFHDVMEDYPEARRTMLNVARTRLRSITRHNRLQLEENYNIQLGVDIPDSALDEDVLDPELYEMSILPEMNESDGEAELDLPKTPSGLSVASDRLPSMILIKDDPPSRTRAEEPQKMHRLELCPSDV